MSQSSFHLAILTGAFFLHGASRTQAQGVSLKHPWVEATRFVRHIDSFVPKRMHELGIPGAAVALVDHGEVVWSKGYGVADKATGAAVTPETVFQAASISKSVTAWGVMRLVEKGKLVLDAPVEGYLTPWHLPASQFDRSGVTIRRLLSHTSGLSVRGYAGLERSLPLPTVEQSLSGDTRGAGAVYLEMQPGTGFSYSGGGYTLLQLVIEEVAQEKFSDYMQREVLHPLGMEHSSFEWTPEIQARTASAYDRSGSLLPNYLYTEAAAAGLYTTAVDLAKFVAASMTGPNGGSTSLPTYTLDRTSIGTTTLFLRGLDPVPSRERSQAMEMGTSKTGMAKTRLRDGTCAGRLCMVAGLVLGCCLTRNGGTERRCSR